MAKVHATIEEARKHLGESVSVIPGRYKERTARADWEGPTTTEEAEANWRAGLAEAQAEDKRRVGARAAGNRKYQVGCAEKGAPVIGTRITMALGEYAKNMGPVLGAMNAAADAAPPRTRDPMMNIDTRLKPVVRAAIEAKKR